jgi:homoserine O-acetyltransferase
MCLAVTESRDAFAVESCAPRATSYEPHAALARGEFELTIAMRHAGPQRLVVRWQRLGDPCASAVVVQGGISADRCATACDPRSAPGWWQAQIGENLALDPREQQIVSIDWLGADGALDAPVDTADQADAIAAVLDRLGIGRIKAFVGASYGALVGLQFAARHPWRLRRLVAISGAHRPHPYASALRSIQRKIVALGQLQCADDVGLSLARQLAMLTYRTPEEFAQRFVDENALDGAHARCAAEDYLETCGARFVASHSPTAFVRLSESIDLHRVDPERITAPLTLVAVEGDVLTPPSDAYALAENVSGPVRVRVLRSLYGHDAFLKDVEPISAILREALRDATEECAVGGAA